MNFYVLGAFAVALPNSEGIMVIKNLCKSFGCSDGFFFVFKEDMDKVRIVGERIVNIIHDNWEKILHPISKAEVEQLGLEC